MIRPRAHLAGVDRAERSRTPRGALLRLDLNELVPGLPDDVAHAILAAVEPWMLTAYPEVFPLYEDLAEHLGVTPEHLVVSAGSDGAIRHAFNVFCDPGDHVVVATPTYGMYPVDARLVGARVTEVPYDASLRLDLQALAAAIRPDTKIVALANPSGATGTFAEPDEVLPVLQRAAEAGAVLLLDEAYLHFVPDHWGPRVDEFPNLLLVRTFSKAAGLAGLRIGYALGSPQVVGWLRRDRANVEVNQVAVVAARFLLRHPEVVADAVARVVAGRRYLADALAPLAEEVREGATNFVLARFPDPVGVAARLAEDGILVRAHPGGGVLEPYLRFTAGDVPVMEPVVAALAAAL